MLIILIVAITSQCIRISICQAVHLKHIQFLFVSYVLIETNKQKEQINPLFKKILCVS